MKRNLEQLANYLVENGALLSREQYYIQNYIAYTPCAKMHEIGRPIFPEEIDEQGNEFREIYSWCVRHKIPLHNAVVFFTELIKKERSLHKDDSLRHELNAILLFVLAGDGFIFKTQFHCKSSRTFEWEIYMCWMRLMESLDRLIHLTKLICLRQQYMNR